MPRAIDQALQLIRENRPESTDRALALLQSTVYSFSMKVCGHRQDAEDTMQDVLLKSIPYLAKFDSPQALTVWLYKVARNQCVSSHRGKKFSRAKNLSLDELMPDSIELRQLLLRETPGPEDTLLNSESAEQLKQAIMAVPMQYRLVLVLHDMEDLSTKEVAQIMDLRAGTVRVRLHRARLSLRRELTRLPKGGGKVTFTLHASVEEPHPPACRRCFVALSDFMDGVIDNSVRDEMDRHLHDCEPCQVLLASLKGAVAQCHSYRPDYDSDRAAELRRDLLPKYQQAVTAPGKI